MFGHVHSSCLALADLPQYHKIFYWHCFALPYRRLQGHFAAQLGKDFCNVAEGLNAFVLDQINWLFLNLLFTVKVFMLRRVVLFFEKGYFWGLVGVVVDWNFSWNGRAQVVLTDLLHEIIVIRLVFSVFSYSGLGHGSLCQILDATGVTVFVS